MTFKSNYNAGTTYNVGDVVCFNDEWFELMKPALAGTPCNNTLYWERASQMVAVVAKFVNDIYTPLTEQISAIPTAELPESDGAYTFTATVDSDEATYSWEAVETPAASDEL